VKSEELKPFGKLHQISSSSTRFALLDVLVNLRMIFAPKQGNLAQVSFSQGKRAAQKSIKTHSLTRFVSKVVTHSFLGMPSNFTSLLVVKVVGNIIILAFWPSEMFSN